MSKVFVASLSPIKTSAVKETVNELLAKNYGAVNVQGVDTKSGINEQPVGLDGMLSSSFLHFLFFIFLKFCRNI